MTIVTKHQDMLPSFTSLFDGFINTDLGDLKRKNFSTITSTFPKVNITERDDAFNMEMAVPGVNKEDFNINLDHKILTVSSNNEEDSLEENQRFIKKEFSYSTFQRSFTLPESVAEDGISATYVNGILKITIPKKEEEKTKPLRTIDIS